jgi:sterol desaturase/sphingolipid hydroxylase (fatty acid hydroxylase superfamily)
MQQLFELVAVAIGTYYAACFIQTVLHAQLGHDRRGGHVFRTHIRQHHAIYSDVFTSSEYLEEDESLTPLYLLPIVVVTALAFWILPLLLASTVLAVFMFSLWLHAYVHVQFHLEHSALSRFEWFRRRQQLHRIHHEIPNTNFGVLDFVCDRLLGTYREDLPAAQRPSSTLIESAS